MGVFEELKKKKIINENEDGSIGINHQELDNVVNAKQENTVKLPTVAQRVSNMSVIKGLNSMIDRIDTSNISNNTTGNLYKTILDTAKSMNPEQRAQQVVDTRQKARNQISSTLKDVNDRLNRPLWKKIQDLANDTGRTTENTWLGGKHAVEDSINYMDTMINGYKTQEEKQIGKALLSNKLSGNEKMSYIISQIADRKNYENSIRNRIDQAFPGLDKNMQNMIVESELQKYDKGLENEQAKETLNNISSVYNSNKDKIDNIVNEDFENRKKEDEKIQTNIEQQTNPISKKLAEVAPSIGQMVPGMGLSMVNPVLGTAYFTSSAGGGYLNDAIERGMTPSQAKKYATIMGTMEGLTEQLSVGNLQKAGNAVKSIIRGTGKEVAKEGLEQVATHTMKEALKDYGIGIAENVLQEAIMEPLQETMAGAIGGQDKANWDNMLDRMWNSGVDGGLVAVITGGSEIGLKSSVAVTDKLSKGIKPTQQEIKTAIQENIKTRGQEAVNNEYIEGTKNGINAVKNEISQQNQQTILSTQENALNQNVVTNNELPVQENNQRGKSFEEIVDEAMSNYEFDEVPSPLQNRDIKTIGKETKVNAYQYDNPEVKPYFQQMAQMLGEDVGNIASSDNRKTTKGGGTALSTNIPAIKQLKEMGYSYNQIIDGIVDIIDDHGQENNALSKKIEIILDDQLRNGYTNSYGQYIRPNEEYISLISKDNVQNNQVLPTKEVSNEASINLPTQGEEINWNEVEKPQGKFRKHYQSIIESSNTTAEAKAIAKEMMGTDTYIPESNKNLIKKADARISNTDPNTELSSLYSRVMNNEKVSDIDIAVGERLIEYYSKIGDSEHLLDAIHATAMAGTQAGRTVQAMALLNHMTPQGQVTWLQRSIDKANTELQDKFKNKKNIPQFELTQDMVDKVLNTNSKEEMYKALDDVYEELGQQVPKSTSEKIDEWRYFSMLANAKTHARNMIGNVAMHATQRVKDKVAGVIEGTVAKFNPKMERTHTIMPASKEVKQFAKNDLKNMDVRAELGMNENKYNPQSRLQNARKTFKSDVLNNTLGKLFDLNSKALEVEDNIGLKSMYVKALSEYITANKLDVNNMTDTQLQKARQYAIKSAQEATFHQASTLATALQQMGRRNKIAKFALDSAVPFKKTPINVAKTGVQYSPVGLIKSAIYDTAQLRKGNITVNQYIDNISKGLTGTGIAYMGYVLAEAGIIKASGDDDDRKEKYDEEQGKQKYSIEIAGNTYSLDWLSPVGIPLFIGVEANQQFNQSTKEKNTKSTDDDNLMSQILKRVSNVASASTKAMNPMSEMSMISGLTDVLTSFNQENSWANIGTNIGKSYVNQFVPTLLGQVARTTDDYERTTKSTKTDPLEKAIDSTWNQIKSKIPGLRQTLPTKTDIWGKDVKQSENLPFRAFNNFLNPAKVQEVSTDSVDKELNNLYARTKESSIIPKTIENKFSINGTDYRMTNDEYAKYSKDYGKTSHDLLQKLIKTNDYKNLTDKQKQEAIEDVYSYAKENNKVNYANKVKEELETSSLYNTIEDLKKNGGNISSYLSYKGKTSDIQGEKETMQKNTILKDSDYDNTTKSIIYRNNTGKNDNLYDLVENINMNQYLDYKIKDSNKEFSADKDKNGKTISGSAKKKVYDYINSTISGYENRLMLLAKEYKLTRAEQQAVVNQIAKTSKSNEEALEKFKKLSSNFEVKDGQVYFK